jgi:hypothetical protein
MKPFACLITCLVSAMSLQAVEWKNVLPAQQWQGSVPEQPKDAGMPEVITSAESFTAAWKRCGRTDAIPEIDWTKNLAVLATTRGSRINLRARIDAGGNLVTNGIATRDILPGFRYALALFPREGVTAVNGKKL